MAAAIQRQQSRQRMTGVASGQKLAPAAPAAAFQPAAAGAATAGSAPAAAAAPVTAAATTVKLRLMAGNGATTGIKFGLLQAQVNGGAW